MESRTTFSGELMSFFIVRGDMDPGQKTRHLLYQPAGIVIGRSRMSTKTQSFFRARSQSSAQCPAFFSGTDRQSLTS